nr:NepR family anti-sigma factor [Microvirga thermotolerans]
MDKTSQKRIGDQLRAMYDELMQQPVPDRFKELLEKLDRSSAERSK